MVIADEALARKALAPYEDLLVRSVHAAWAKWQTKKFEEASKLTVASAMHDMTIREVGIRVAGMPGTKLKERARRTFLCLADGYVVQFKKLDKDLLPRNYPTQLARAILGQHWLPGFPKLPKRLVLGYRLNELGTDIRDVSIVCTKGRSVLFAWSLTAPALTQGELIPFAPAASRSPADISAQKRIRPKIRRDETRDSEGGKK